MNSDTVVGAPTASEGAHLDVAALSVISINTIRDMVVWIAPDARIVFSNAAARTYFTDLGFDIETDKLYEMVPDFNIDLWKVHWQNLLEHKAFRFESAHKSRSGALVPVEVSVNLVELDGQQYNCAIFHDIAERKRPQNELSLANKNLEMLSLTDALSGLGNRRAFDQSIIIAHDRHRVTGAPISLILIDLDFFKAYNDTYGHVSGDECLRRVGEVLRRCSRRDGDVVARIGGEEFACILPGTPHAGALAVANATRDMIIALGLPHAASSVAPIVTASFGVVTSACAGTVGPQSLVEAADRCLYASKAAGRNRITSQDLCCEALVA